MSSSTPSPTPSSAPGRAYVRPPTLRLLGWVVHAVCLYLLVSGLAYSIGAATQAPATVRVPVAVTATTPGAEAGGFALTDRSRRLDDVVPAGAGEGIWVTARDDAATFTVSSWGSTRLEQFLSRGDRLVLGLAAVAVSVLLQPVLTSLAGPRPFARRNSRRFAAMAVTVLVAAVLHPLLPRLASRLVLDRLGNPPALAVPDLQFPLLPVAAVVVALLLLAEAFRHAERLEHEVDGLV
ncbi:hypothetical protein AB2L27_13945 [Kineococcus sp. LSe6-4]|uniref:DUF2975 domain-containing protein n=1 Tax=Kineococcus halophytocola TaxID=3234027 RepID=A0ABV4H2R2_9ACTN